MQFDNEHIQNLITPYKAFLAEGFNIFGIGGDDLPHLICACPDKSTARAIKSLLEDVRITRLQHRNEGVKP